ncbi:MAG: hypothetical protein ACXVYV_08825 [Gaiellales bacterium]
MLVAEGADLCDSRLGAAAELDRVGGPDQSYSTGTSRSCGYA